MKPQSETELVDLIVDWVRKNTLANGSSHLEITGDTDLMKSGLLDSSGFVELMMFIESERGHSIDLTDVDPSDFLKARGLSRVALRNGQRGDRDAAHHEPDR